MKRNNDIRPRKAWYVLSLLLFLGGTAGFFAVLYLTFASCPKGTQFMVPGSVTVHVGEPARYVLWDEVNTLFQGRTYASSEELPGGVQMVITETPTGRLLQLAPSSGGSETSGSVRRKAIGTIDFDRPGSYVVDVRGDFAERVFYLRPSMAARVLRNMAIMTLLGFTAWLLAPVIAIVILVRRSNAQKDMTQKVSAAAARSGAEPGRSLSPADERTFAMFCHLGALSGFVLPLGNIIVPLILWLIKKDESSFVDVHGRESLNFQISILIYTVISAFLIFVIIGFFLLAMVWLFNVIAVIIAAVRANNHDEFRYPLSIRLIGRSSMRSEG